MQYLICVNTHLKGSLRFKASLFTALKQSHSTTHRSLVPRDDKVRGVTASSALKVAKLVIRSKLPPNLSLYFCVP